MVKQGYKKTEVGVIPEDWDVRTLETLYNITSSKRVFQSQWRKGGIPFYRAREIAVMSEGKPAPEDLYIDVILYDLYTRQYGSIKKDDVLITGVGTLGKVYVVKENDQFYFKDGNIIWLQFKGGFSSQYLKHQYDMPVLINQVFGNAGGSTVATYTITNAKATKVPIPPLDEQKRIAEALSDVDSMISSLEKLIAKKKAVKQGAMQELLTGRKRLSGFTEEWVEKKIEDIVVRFATGLNPRQNFKLNNGGTNYYVTIKDFREGKLFLDDACDRIDNAALERINERSDLKKNDLLFSSIGRIGDAYLITETPKNWNINESVFALRPNLQIVSPLMLYYLLTSEDVKNKLLDSTTGSTLKSIKLGHLKEITCRFPKVIEEQIAIASMLFDMDNEIEALAQKLKKTRQIKQGMMQQLLTGKIRLV